MVAQRAVILLWGRYDLLQIHAQLALRLSYRRTCVFRHAIDLDSRGWQVG
jgi:hypothetical protein